MDRIRKTNCKLCVFSDKVACCSLTKGEQMFKAPITVTYGDTTGSEIMDGTLIVFPVAGVGLDIQEVLFVPVL